jgi:YidC/Oxa1 family membrane protein insertase
MNAPDPSKKPPPEKGKEASKEQEPGSEPKKPDPDPSSQTNPSPAKPLEEFEEQLTMIANDVLAITFTNRGGAIKRAVFLDQYPTADIRDARGEPLVFLDVYGAHVDKALIGALSLSHVTWPQAQLESGRWECVADEPNRRVTFTRKVKRGQDDAYELEIKKQIWLPYDGARHLEFKISYAYAGTASGDSTYTDEFKLFTSGGVWQERGSEGMNPPASFIFPEEADSEDGLLVPGQSVKDKEQGQKTVLKGDRRFIADLSSYFGAFLYAEDGFPAALQFDLQLGIGAGAHEQQGFLYLGSLDVPNAAPDLVAERPEAAEVLGSVAEDRLGFARAIARIILALLRWLHGVCGNWGWAIILLTLIVRALLFPINRRSQGAMLRHGEAMAKIKPKIEALKKKHEKDPKKFAQEQMALMKREGVSMVPLGGCLPLLLQLPIFFGLFSALRTSIDLRQASWWWVGDLSQPDHLITFDSPIWNPMQACGGCCNIPIAPITGLHALPILMTFAWFLNSYLMPKPTTTDPQMEQQRKMMMFMPVFFGFMMYGYAAGLSLYWLTSSTIGIFETKVIKKFFPVKGPPGKEPEPKRA